MHNERAYLEWLQRENKFICVRVHICRQNAIICSVPLVPKIVDIRNNITIKKDRKYIGKERQLSLGVGVHSLMRKCVIFLLLLGGVLFRKKTTKKQQKNKKKTTTKKAKKEK